MTNDTYAADPLVQAMRPRYPRLVAALATVPEGARHLRRIADLDRAWVRQQGAPQPPPVVVERVADASALAPAAMPAFDIIYAGGGLNLLNAAVLAGRYGRRVLVFDRFTVGAVHREWNISYAELRELVDVGLLTPDEMESVIQRRYREGLVRFHCVGIHTRPSELRMRGVLDVAVDADALTALCLRKIRAASADNLILDDLTFAHAWVDDRRVVVQAHGADGTEHWFAARLFIDGMGATSPVACQLNCGAPFTLVCPTVGTVARGYRVDPARAPGGIDPALGEILVTTEHARDGRQLIWEAFPGQEDQAAIYLFSYQETGRAGADAPESILLPLFEDFFTHLPAYKDTTNVSIFKPVYGFIPAGYKNPSLRGRDRKVLACDRVLSLGDAAALQSPLTFCGFGSNARNLRRITALLDLALSRDRLRAGDLAQIRAAEAVPALSRAFSKFMIAKPPEREPPEQVNETLNVFCGLLDHLGERATREFFQDRVRWWDYTQLVLRTAVIYPRIFPLTARTLTPGDGAAWLAAYLAFTATAARNALGRAVLESFSRTPLAGKLDAWLWRHAPRVAWRLATAGAGLRQALRVLTMTAPDTMNRVSHTAMERADG
jgi:lycopene cyclase CruA